MIQQLEATRVDVRREVQLQRLEQTFQEKIAAAKRLSEEAGQALREIRDERLYLLRGHNSFDDYCVKVWGFNRRYGDRLVEMAETCDAIRGDESGRSQLLPLTEWQQRPMGGLEPEEKREVWANAQELAGEQAPTHGHVAQAVREFKGDTVENVSMVVETPKPKLPANVDTLGAELATLEEREALLEGAAISILTVWDSRADTQESPAEWDARMDKLMEQLRELVL